MTKAIRIAFLMLTLTSVVLFTGCNRIADPLAGSPEPPIDVHASTWAYTTPLLAGQTINVGNVNIAFTYNYVTINYEITDLTWWLTTAHADIELDSLDFPNNNGNPNPGGFAYKQDPIDPPVHTYTFTIPNTDEWRKATELYVAAHCEVVKIVDGHIVQTETGWGDGHDFWGHNWATFIVFKVKKVIHLPDFKVSAQYSGVTATPFGYAPTQFHIWGIGEKEDVPYVIWDGYWPSFCLDLHTYIYGTDYKATLWDSYDPMMPVYARCFRSDGVTPVRYDKINFLLNYLIEDYGSVPQDWDPKWVVGLQLACWYYRGYLNDADIAGNAEAVDLVGEAEEKGDGFYPAVGQYMVVPIDINENIQLCCLVLDP